MEMEQEMGFGAKMCMSVNRAGLVMASLGVRSGVGGCGWGPAWTHN